MRRTPLSSLILLFLGVIFLLNNLGYFPWDLWTNVFKFWPIILIVISLEMLFTKNGSPRLLVVAIILIFALPFFLQGKGLPFNLNFNFLNSATGTTTLPLEKKLGTLIGANLNFDLKSDGLKLNSLEKNSTLLLKGGLGYNRLVDKPTVNFDPKDGVAALDILAQGGSLPINLLSSTWELSLSQLVPFQITAKSSGGKFDLDFTNLEVTKLNLELGKTETNLNFGKIGSLRATISATDGSITVNLPTDKAAHLELPEGTTVEIATRFAKVNQGYETEDFSKAKDKIEINFNPGKAKVTIN